MYNVPVTWRVHGRVDVPALEAAVRDVVLRHEALRTVFPSSDGQAHQLVLTPDEVRVVADHRSVDAADVRDALAEAIGHRFDLSAELPVRLSVLDAGDDTVVALVIHHIAVDEWSTKALLTDLATAYTLRQAGQAPEWTQPTVQYADFTLWQRELLGDPADAESLAARSAAYCGDALAGLPEELPLPTDRTRPARTSYRGGAVPFALDPEVVRALRELARAQDVSMFMVVQAAVAVLLAAYGGGEDIPLGTPVSGRGDAQLEDLVGFFLNTLVLRTDLSGDPTVAELLDRIRRTDLEAFDHQDLPFEQVVDAVLGSDRSVSRALHPLFQVMIVYLVEPIRAARMGSPRVSPPNHTRWRPRSSTCPSTSSNMRAPTPSSASSSTAPTCTTAAPSNVSPPDSTGCYARWPGERHTGACPPSTCCAERTRPARAVADHTGTGHRSRYRRGPVRRRGPPATRTRRRSWQAISNGPSPTSRPGSAGGLRACSSTTVSLPRPAWRSCCPARPTRSRRCSRCSSPAAPTSRSNRALPPIVSRRSSALRSPSSCSPPENSCRRCPQGTRRCSRSTTRRSPSGSPVTTTRR